MFKCLTDNIMLDDFSTELKKISGGQSSSFGAPDLSTAGTAAVPGKQEHVMAEVENAAGQARWNI